MVLCKECGMNEALPNKQVCAECEKSVNRFGPELKWDSDAKAIVLYCSDELWYYLTGLRDKGLDSLDVIQVAKIYAVIKKMLEKGKVNDKESNSSRNT